MGKYDRLRFTVITVERPVALALKRLKRNHLESLSSVIDRLLKQTSTLSWSFVTPVTPEVREYWESGMYDTR